jgi:predicted nucleic acid-binding Zn ribbon protein
MTQKQNFNKGPASTAARQGGFMPLKKLLKETAKEYHLESTLNRQKALTTWHGVVSGFIEDAQRLTQAVDFSKGVLTVACLSREAAYKIKLMAERIIAALNEVLGQRMVYAIYIEV